MPDPRDLDTRIRELVARAVASAPPPPEVELSLQPNRAPSPGDHRAWWLGGGAAVLAAAAIVTAFVLVAGTDEHITTPNTTPDTTPAPTTVATTVAPTTTTTTTPVPSAGPVTVTAGPDGVTVLEGGTEVRHLDQPAEIALLTPGGAVILQPAAAAPDGPAGDPIVWRPDGTIDTLLGPLGERQSYHLYDIADVDGIPTVLYSIRRVGADEGSATAVEDFHEVVNALAMAPDGWTTTQVTDMNTWESGFSRLALTDRGLVVGATYHEAAHAFFGAAVPGTPADDGTDHADPTPLGIPASFGDRSDCPDHFTVSSDGGLLAWTEGAQLVVFDTTSGATQRWPVAALSPVAGITSLDVRSTPDDGIEAAVSFAADVDGTAAAPVIITVSPSGAVAATPAAGRLVTFGP